MRLLHAGHVDGCSGSAHAAIRTEPRSDPGASLRQLLSVHRLSRHCRCSRGSRACAAEVSPMTEMSAKPEALSVLDRPNSYIGKTVPRPNLDRLMQGRGTYVSDMELPRMAHVVFLRSPHAHARILGIDAAAAKQMPGVAAVVTGVELNSVM